MTASPANGFVQIQYDPTGTSCNAIPYAFHPMYSTASEQTRVPWAAHSYNVAFSDEIGHFQFCNGATVPATPFGLDSSGNPVTCPAGNTEGSGANQQPTDSDDDFCFPASEALLYRVQGCTETNTRLRRGFLHPGLAGRQHPAAPDPVPVHQRAHRRPLRPAVPANRLRGRPAGRRTDLQPDHRHRLHADTADRQRHAGPVLPVLHHHERQGHLHLAVRQRHPGRDHQLRAQRPVRVAAAADLSRLRRRWQHRQPVQRTSATSLPTPARKAELASTCMSAGRPDQHISPTPQGRSRGSRSHQIRLDERQSTAAASTKAGCASVVEHRHVGHGELPVIPQPDAAPPRDRTSGPPPHAGVAARRVQRQRPRLGDDGGCG